MSSIRISSWPAQEPPAGFAARAVEAMQSSERHQRRSRRPRTVFYLAIAAILATGTAMAIWGAARKASVHLGATSAVPVSFEPVGISMQAHTFITKSHAAAEPSISSAPRKAASVSSSRAAQPAPSSSGSFPRRQPACQCERGYSDFICDCY